MEVYRISKCKYANDLSGKGAELYGGRWNSKGIPAIYTSSSRALAITEVLAHLPAGIVPSNYCIVTINIPSDVSMQVIKINTLSKNWNSFPHNHSTQIIGDEFLNNTKFLVLQVPSAIVPYEHNFILNPRHVNSKQIKIADIDSFNFDERLIKL